MERKLPERPLETIQQDLQKQIDEKTKLKDKIERSEILIRKINDYKVFKKEKDRQDKIKLALTGIHDIFCLPSVNSPGL